MKTASQSVMSTSQKLPSSEEPLAAKEEASQEK